MSRVDDLIKENLSENGEILTLKEKMLGLRGTMELAGKEVLSKLRGVILNILGLTLLCALDGPATLMQTPPKPFDMLPTMNEWTK